MNKKLSLHKYGRRYNRIVYIPGYKPNYWPWVLVAAVLIMATFFILVSLWPKPITTSEKLSAAYQPEPTASPSPSSVETNYGQLYNVASVVDGDTIKIEYAGKLEKVRFIGINTPETVDPSKPVECYGPESSAYTKSKLLNQSVYLVTDGLQGDRDKYDRLLRYIYTQDHTNFNELLVHEGYATYEEQYPVATSYKQAFQTAENYAKNSKLGLWGKC